MIERVLEQKSLDQKRLDLMPQDSVFKILEEISKVIKPFYHITSQTSGEEYVTMLTNHKRITTVINKTKPTFMKCYPFKYGYV